MSNKPEIVWLSQSNPANHDRYNYALCQCCVIPEAIRFPKAGFSNVPSIPMPSLREACWIRGIGFKNERLI